MKAENVPELSRRLNEYAKMHMDSKMLIPVQRPELKLQPSEVTIELIELIQRMEPFGQDMRHFPAASSGCTSSNSYSPLSVSVTVQERGATGPRPLFEKSVQTGRH